MKNRPDLLLDALRRHAEEQGIAAPERVAANTLETIEKTTRGFTHHRPFTVNDMMRKVSSNG